MSKDIVTARKGGRCSIRIRVVSTIAAIALIAGTLSTVPRSLLGGHGDSSSSVYDADSYHTVCVKGEVPFRRRNEGRTWQQTATTHSLLHEAVRTILLEELGPLVSAAVYDPAILPQVALSFTKDGDSMLGWSLEPVPPPLSNWEKLFPSYVAYPPLVGQRTTSERLLFLHRTTSIAIGRVHRDASLEALLQDPKSRSTATGMLRRLLRAQISTFFIVLQTIIDVADPQLRSDILDRYPTASHNMAVDPLIHTLAALDAHDSASIVKKKLMAAIACSDTTQGAPHHSNNVAPYASAFVLEYHRLPFQHQEPAIAKYWNTFRQSTSCNHLVRLCDLPESCRFVCNPAYLTKAGLALDAGATKRVDGVFHHRLIGFGSNNEYDWEETTSGMFNRAGGHPIGSLSTFDCTLGHRGGFQPTKRAASIPGMRTVPLCVDQVANDQNTRLDGVKRLIVDAEKGNLKHGAIQHGPRPKSVAEMPSQYFDDVSIYKIDVEGFEHAVFHQWAKFELRDMGHSNVLSGAFKREVAGDQVNAGTSMIDFSKDVDSFFTVSMLQFEFHSVFPPKVPKPHAIIHAQRLMQYLTSLGFIQVVQERNAYGNDCFEYLFVHYRYFIRSETWSVQNSR